MNNLNQTLTIKTDYLSPKDVMDDINNLYRKYLSVNKKSSKSELVYSMRSNKKNTSYNLAIWFNNSCKEEALSTSHALSQSPESFPFLQYSSKNAGKNQNR